MSLDDTNWWGIASRELQDEYGAVYNDAMRQEDAHYKSLWHMEVDLPTLQQEEQRLSMQMKGTHEYGLREKRLLLQRNVIVEQIGLVNDLDQHSDVTTGRSDELPFEASSFGNRQRYYDVDSSALSDEKSQPSEIKILGSPRVWIALVLTIAAVAVAAILLPLGLAVVAGVAAIVIGGVYCWRSSTFASSQSSVSRDGGGGYHSSVKHRPTSKESTLESSSAQPKGEKKGSASPTPGPFSG